MAKISHSQFGKIGILYGGPSAEREVSLKSGEGVYQALREEGVAAVLIDATGEVKKKISDAGIDIAFIALHGKFGEDGTIQRILEALDIPYTGSGVRASELGLNKVKEKEVFLSRGIPTPDFEVVRTPSTRIKFPLVVKPVDEGSALGVSIVPDEKGFPRAVKEARKFSEEVLVERYIPGVEVTCAVLGNEELCALPPIEIVPRDKFFSFTAKYAAGGALHIIPPRLPEEVCEKVKEVSLLAHRALVCQGITRSDLIVEKKKKVWLLEVNTIPGFTRASLVPDAARAAGMSMGELCIRTLELAKDSQMRSKLTEQSARKSAG